MGSLKSSVVVPFQVLMMIQLSSASIPRTGFVTLPFNHSMYHIQSPYNLPESKHYSFVDGVHECWVYSADLPHSRTSHTKPRTEGYIYKSGVWQSEGYSDVPSGTSGVSIMQVFHLNHTRIYPEKSQPYWKTGN